MLDVNLIVVYAYFQIVQYWPKTKFKHVSTQPQPCETNERRLLSLSLFEYHTYTPAGCIADTARVRVRGRVCVILSFWRLRRWIRACPCASCTCVPCRSVIRAAKLYIIALTRAGRRSRLRLLEGRTETWTRVSNASQWRPGACLPWNTHRETHDL